MIASQVLDIKIHLYQVYIYIFAYCNRSGFIIYGCYNSMVYGAAKYAIYLYHTQSQSRSVTTRERSFTYQQTKKMPRRHGRVILLNQQLRWRHAAPRTSFSSPTPRSEHIIGIDCDPRCGATKLAHSQHQNMRITRLNITPPTNGLRQRRRASRARNRHSADSR